MNRKAPKLEVEKDSLFQAVVIADSFHKNFAPVTSCPALLPLANRMLLDYCLDWLHMSYINEVIMFCSSSSVNEIKRHLNNKYYLSMEIKVFVSEGCHSYGDIMRALDKYAVIRNTFILVTSDIIGNVNLLPIFNKFKALQQDDKGLCMMLLLKEIGNMRDDLQNNAIYTYNSNNRLIHYQMSHTKYVDLPTELLLEHDFVDIRSDLLSCGVAVCSAAIPPLFSDNFDFQTLHDLIRELLVNEEILRSTIYCQILNQSEYVAQVRNWPLYQTVSQDVIRRWCYPMVPDISQRYIYRKNSIYLKDVTFSKDCKLGFDVVIGSNTKLNKSVTVNNSVIGNNCQIGEEVIIENSFIFNGVIINSGSVIKYSIIGDGCHINRNCSLDQNCILGAGVILEEETKIINVRLVGEKYSDKRNFSKLSQSTYFYKLNDENSDSEDEVPGLLTEKKGGLDPVLYDNEQDSSDNESEGSAVAVDDVHIFYNEVLDSLTRGYEDGLECKNLILEINSSRYAYNIAVNEVNYNLIKAIMSINLNTQSASGAEIGRLLIEKMKYFRPLIENYIRNENAQKDCLLAFEKVVMASTRMCQYSPGILKLFYDFNIVTEDVILDWYSKMAEEASSVRTALKPFIEWLQEAEEETDDSD